MVSWFRSCLVLAIAGSLIACSGGDGSEEEDIDDAALAGNVAEGTVVKTKAALRLRRTPRSTSPENIISVLPKETEVRVRIGTPTKGFYFVEIVDAVIARRAGSETGWVYGAYLTGARQEPDLAPDAPGAATPLSPAPPPAPAAPPPRREQKVKFTSASCQGLADDRGGFMFPTLDHYVNTAGYQDAIALGIDSNEYPYGTLVRLQEVEALPGIAKFNRPPVFKIVKTTGTRADTPTVTLCATLPVALPAQGSQLTLKVVDPGF